MRLNPPTVFIFLISLVMVGLAVISKMGFVDIPEQVPNQAFWLSIFGYIVLMLGNLVRGL